VTDYQQGKREVLAALREVAELAEQAGATSLSRALRDDRIPRLEEDRFHLVVLGEFNHGKTTLVNAMLGESVLPVGVTPTTAVIHHIEHGGVPAAVAVTEDGTRSEVPLDSLGEYVVGGGAAKDHVQHVEVRHPAKVLEDGVVLVDTPGVNDLNLQRAEITYGYVPRSDAVIFILDAGQILKESERQFITGKLLSASRDKLFFIINKMDLLTEEESREAVAYAKTHLAKLVPDPRVYPLSAEKAVEGDRQGSGLESFLADLRVFLEQERGRVVLRNAVDHGLRTVGLLRTSIDVRRKALGMDQGELEERLRVLEGEIEGSGKALEARERKVRESIAATKAMVRHEVESFGKSFALALPQEIESSKAVDLKRYLPGFIEERFRELAERQGEEVARRLERVAEEAIAFVEDDARGRAQRLAEALGPAATGLDLRVNTFAYDVGVFALGAFGLTIMALSNVLVGGALTLAAPILAYVFRGRADKEVRRRAIEEAPQAVREAAAKLADAFDRQIDSFGDKLVDFLAKATEETTRSIAEVLQSVRAARQEGDHAVARLESSTGPALARLAALESRLRAQAPS